MGCLLLTEDTCRAAGVTMVTMTMKQPQLSFAKATLKLQMYVCLFDSKTPLRISHHAYPSLCLSVIRYAYWPSGLLSRFLRL